MARAIQSSNSIEGHHVSVADAAALVDNDAVSDADDHTTMVVAGYCDAMTYVLELSDEPINGLGPSLLHALHFMLTKHDLGVRPGRARVGAVYVRDDSTGEVVHEGAPSSQVADLLLELTNRLAIDDAAPVVVAAMAHLNLVMIHPWLDGNGRMGRILQSMVLTREGILGPEFCSIEEELGRETRHYYDVLAEVGGGRWQPDRDARPWLEFSLDAHHRQARRLLQRVREATRAWSELEVIVERDGLPERSLPALLEATAGRPVRNVTYRSFAAVSDQVATRDLKHLVDAGLFIAVGSNRGRSYRRAPALDRVFELASADRVDLRRNVYDMLDDEA